MLRWKETSRLAGNLRSKLLQNVPRRETWVMASNKISNAQKTEHVRLANEMLR
jgi:hypothetical protein